jgi:PAS domain S-box-containing protein
VHSEYLSEYDNVVLQKYLERGWWVGEVLQRAKNGEKRFVFASVNKRYDESGTEVGAVAINRDITNFKQIEEAQQKSAAIIDTILDSVITTNIDGEILSWNAGAESLFGYTAAEIIGKSIGILYKETELNLFKSLITEVGKGKNISGIQLTSLNKNKDEVYILLSLTSLKDKNGTITELVGVSKDITALVNAETKLHTKRQNLELVEQVTGLGSWDWDIDLGKIVWSDNMYKILGYYPGEVEPHYAIAKSNVHPHDVAFYEAKLAQALASETSFSFEYRIVRADNSTIWVRSEGKVIRDKANNAHRMFGTVLDISANKLAEMALQKLSQQLLFAREEERRQVAYELHNDVGQTLTALSMNLQLLRYETSNAKLTKIIETAIELAQVANKKIRDVSYGLRPPVLETLGLNAAIENLCQEFMGQTGLAIAYSGEEIRDMSEPIAINLYRILQEALANAARHAEAKNIKVLFADFETYFSLDVWDDGQGFDFNKQLYEQGNFGLGLLAMREHATQLKGRFKIESHVGQGTRIRVEIPKGQS